MCFVTDRGRFFASSLIKLKCKKENNRSVILSSSGFLLLWCQSICFPLKRLGPSVRFFIVTPVSLSHHAVMATMFLVSVIHITSLSSSSPIPLLIDASAFYGTLAIFFMYQRSQLS